MARAKPGPKPKIKIQPIDSSEWQEWHLMLDGGWREGAQKLDCMPKAWKCPTDLYGRVLTCRVGDRQGTVFEWPEFYIEEKWRTQVPELLREAIKRHGRWPPDFRVETLAKHREDWLEDACSQSEPE